jgi:hypothetical protein
MTAGPVRMRGVIYLEPECMLQEVPRLLVCQARDDRCPRSDVHDLQLLQLRIPTRDNTHEAAQSVARRSRVVYVELPPAGGCHAAADLASDSR